LADCDDICVEDVATTEKEATRLLDAKQYDLIVADIELAEGNGFDVVRHTLAKDYSYAVPVTVMLTNHANSYYRNLAHTLNIKYFFDKSMDFEAAILAIVSESVTH
jgi:CheY-like chemotaxis protein